MAVISSQAYFDVRRMCRTRRCKSCGLFIHQEPIFDDCHAGSIFWVGLSAVRFDEHQDKRPLSPLTPSGALIESIESPFRSRVQFYKTNIVKCVPLNEDRIRYPLAHEMEKCFPNFEWELDHLKPKTVFLLGKQVANFVFKKFTNSLPPSITGFEYLKMIYKDIEFIPVHHPSYILVYKRKQIESYKEAIRQLFPVQHEQCVLTA